MTYMREEEKLARDVYVKLAGTSGNPVFTRIAASEQRHMDALGRVITPLRPDRPGKGQGRRRVREPGAPAALQPARSPRAAASPAAAIDVGRSIEKLDIADLNNREATSKHADVRWVFQQLERGSNMHLRAFNMQAR